MANSPRSVAITRSTRTPTPYATRRSRRATPSSIHAISSRSGTRCCAGSARRAGRTGTAAAFGVSRPAFYAAAASFEQAGLPGLVPERPGPRRAHKLSDPVVDVLAVSLAADPSRTSADLARIAQERFGLVVHRRSVERALARRKRGLRQQG